MSRLESIKLQNSSTITSNSIITNNNNNNTNSNDNNNINSLNSLNTIQRINGSTTNDNHFTPPPVSIKYSGLQQKKTLMNKRIHGRKFFDSADWCLGMQADFEQPLLNAALISTPPNKAR